jgi:hypothetical protein
MTGQPSRVNPSARLPRGWFLLAVAAEVVWLIFLVWMAWQA